MMEMLKDRARLVQLVHKYNRPGPRYTSYPTAPQFKEDFGPDDYLAALEEDDVREGDLSLYVHLPFCRSLCFYCGCHMMVTHRPEKVSRYLAFLKQEIDAVSRHVTTGRRVVQLHWGGGTPTFLTPAQIKDLMGHLQRRFNVAPGAEVSIECDPRGLTRQHMLAAREAGFNRVSFGVQDFDPDVQAAIGRVQPYQDVQAVTRWARELGFDGISYDLIYGLPHQSVPRFEETVRKVIGLAPDRVSVFSYAHVPWMKKHQRVIDEAWLPAPEEKLNILLNTMDLLTREGGYRYIGMDHFARPEDALSTALDAGTMQRNFQGYSTHAGSTLLGFGVSAISQTENVYAQNEKDLQWYYASIESDCPPIYRGYRLTDDDLLRRFVIMKLMNTSHLSFSKVEERFGIDFRAYFADALHEMEAFEADGLLMLSDDAISVTELGRFLIRNIAMAFDAYLDRKEPGAPQYSQTV